MVDPIADFLTQIRNAQMARELVVEIPYSKLKENIANVMQKNGFLEKVEVVKSGKFPVLKLTLRAKPIQLKKVSRCGQRIYTQAEKIRKVRNGFGIAIISTSQGIMTGYQARAKNIGGEILCEIS
ncbi:30S ribosomal protein S8 [Candidatus Gracilibacteria bacterium]|nr:30S ribosomal protein S8 [Candidatus Gracilibacteria bacterium]MCF7819103.1 30S ribosomal protein S8 [Candidatus Gracilibacteria bacterium]